MLCKNIDDLMDNGASLNVSVECDPTDTNCPINKNENPNSNNYPKGILLGVWAKRNSQYKVRFERPMKAK